MGARVPDIMAAASSLLARKSVRCHTRHPLFSWPARTGYGYVNVGVLVEPCIEFLLAPATESVRAQSSCALRHHGLPRQCCDKHRIGRSCPRIRQAGL